MGLARPAQLAGRHDEVGFTVSQRGEHGDQQPLVMLQIGVDHRNQLGRAGEGALHDCAGETPAAEPADALNPVIAG